MPDPGTTLRVAALRLLTRRDYCRAELERKLATLAESPEQLSSVLDRLQAENLLSDQRFAAQRVQARAGRYGNRRLERELQQRGVAESDIEAALPEAGNETERCRAVWARKFGQVPDSREAWAKQLRFLQYRGFSSEAIRQTLSGVEE